MAISKNFVIKNGLEVDTNTLFVDNILNYVGVATTVPRHHLDVRGKMICTDIQCDSIIVNEGLSLQSASGVATFVGLYVTSLSVSGISTYSELDVATRLNVAPGITSVRDFRAVGLSTFEGYLRLNQGLNVTGITSLANRLLIGTGGTIFTTTTGGQVAIGTDVAPYRFSVVGQGETAFYVNGNTRIDGTLNCSDIAIAGIAATALDITSNFTVAGISTFTGAIDGNGGATIDNIQLGITGNNEIDTSSGNLTIDSAGGLTTIDDNLTVAGYLAISGAGSTFTNVVDMNGGATIDNIRIGIAGDNEIDTSTGNLTIDSNGGTTTIDDTLSVTGDLNLTGGFNLAEYIVHDGDTNTKFGFPSADTITAETGGSERLRIDSSGRLLVGTTTEGENSANDFTIADDTGNVGMTIRSANTEACSLFFSDATTGAAEYAGYIQYAHGTDQLRLGSAGSIDFRASATSTSFMHIDSSGNVGIASAAPSTPLYVVGDTTLSGDTTFHGDSYNLVWDKSDNALEFADNAKVLIGTGGDLELYHDGSHSYITDSGTGNLKITVSQLDILGSSETLATFVDDGAVTLYFDNAVKLGTTAGGAKVTGNLETTGISTATGGFVGALTGTATNATNVTVADESSDTSCNVLFTTAATGDLAPKSGTNLTFNSSSGALTATSFVGAFTGNVTGTATNATHVTVADNEATNENNLIPFIEDASATGNVGLESDGDFHYNPSTGTVTATLFAGSGANLTSVPMTVTETSYGGTSQISYASNTLTITANSNAYGYRTVSTSDPSSGENGDVWYKY